MNATSAFQGVLIRYVLAQAALVPLMAFSWLVLPKRASLAFQWTFHRVLVVLAVVLPILLALPVSSRIVHALGDESARSPIAAPAGSVTAEAPAATFGEPGPFSPPPPAGDTAVAGEPTR